MERQIPKNVRQIGNVSDTPKIYVEDYVDTFLSGLGEKCAKPGSEPMGAFLVGELQKSQDEEYVYIYGAIQMRHLKIENGIYEIEDETWKQAFEDCKQYFDDAELLGWFVVRNGIPLVPDEPLVRLHQKSFPKENTVFIMRDPSEKEEVYFVHKMNDLMEISGHYTYYEKNPCMQNYMISTRKKNGAVSSETVEDRAAKDFRELIRSKEQFPKKRRSSVAMYALSTCLVLVVIVMGVVMVNSFDRMKSVQKALDHLNTETAGDLQAKEVSSGAVTAVQGTEAGEEGSDAQGNEDVSGTAKEDADENAAAKQNETGQDTASPEGTGPEGTGPEGTGYVKGNASSGMEDLDSGENGSNGIYIVEKGDTLAIISKKIYGDLEHIDAICSMNGLANGNLIYVGQKLLLP